MQKVVRGLLKGIPWVWDQPSVYGDAVRSTAC